MSDIQTCIWGWMPITWREL